ncbi:hypothetical protein DYY67_0400 [Candidatus Nitrosotalea sp. TS]|nr:hypothetical protein [Candidatus Nitrosotalea sp. TS]
MTLLGLQADFWICFSNKMGNISLNAVVQIPEIPEKNH